MAKLMVTDSVQYEGIFYVGATNSMEGKNLKQKH